LALGTFSWLEAGYRYRWVRRFPYSVSEEHGTSAAVAARWYGRALGAPFDEVMLTLDGRAYVNNPLFDNHVLALRLASALALGPDYREGFVLGGAQGSSIFTVQTDATFPLRGFPIDLDRYPAGIGLVAGYAEYRLPLWHVERGLWTLPFYVERLHLGLFCDAGNTFGTRVDGGPRQALRRAWNRLRGGRVGTGLEVRGDVRLGWAFPLTWRLGVAVPVVEYGRPRETFARLSPTYYVALGSAL